MRRVSGLASVRDASSNAQGVTILNWAPLLAVLGSLSVGAGVIYYTSGQGFATQGTCPAVVYGAEIVQDTVVSGIQTGVKAWPVVTGDHVTAPNTPSAVLLRGGAGTKYQLHTSVVGDYFAGLLWFQLGAFNSQKTRLGSVPYGPCHPEPITDPDTVWYWLP